MPEVLDYHLNAAQKINTFFVGAPEIVLERFTSSTMGPLDEDELPVNQLKNFTELDRLAYVIRSIDWDAFVVPEGAFKMLPTKQMRENDDFSGLSAENLTNLGKYLHFRTPVSSEKVDLINRNEATFNYSFLDDCGAEERKEVWSVSLDNTKTIALIKNLEWPGYFGFHKCNSAEYGSYYIGNGIKNVDLSYML